MQLLCAFDFALGLCLGEQSKKAQICKSMAKDYETGHILFPSSRKSFAYLLCTKQH